MVIRHISDSAEIPDELIDFKIEHYQEIFKEDWEKVYTPTSLESEGKEMLIILDNCRPFGKVAGGCVFKKNTYSVQFEDFAILPEYRRKGYSRKLMQELENITERHHYDLLNSGKKPNDINLMYLRSLIYLDNDDSGKAVQPHLQFAFFLRKAGFNPYVHNKYELSEKEEIALQLYHKNYPEQADNLRVFKKEIVNEGVILKPDSRQELLVLDERQWKIVMGGLNWKLGNYGKTGKVSYRYDLCPICADMGSSEMNSDNCQKCYIYKTCMEPFREVGRFKEDFEVSDAYFSEMRSFMTKHPPKNIATGETK